MNNNLHSILEGIRVIDFGVWAVGPVAASHLGDMGADVIKIERPGTGDPWRGLLYSRGEYIGLPGDRQPNMEHQNRNKRGITLDVSKDEGKEIFFRLVKTADVVITNLRVGALRRLDINYEKLAKINPKLIYVHTTGFGGRGPDAEAGGYDTLAQARSSMMSITGDEGLPPQSVGGALMDHGAALMTAFGAVSALLARERSGIGQQVETSQLISAMTFINTELTQDYLLGRTVPRGQRAKSKAPLTNYYKCKDDRWVMVMLLQHEMYYSAFCQAVGISELANDPRFKTIDALLRDNNYEKLTHILDELFATKPAQEWANILKQADMPSSIINRPLDLLSDPQVLANEYIVDWDHPALGRIKFPGFPVKYSKTPLTYRLPCPELGQHSEEILLELGYTWEDIGKFSESRVI